MDDVKSLFASKTFWGCLVAAVGGAAGVAGHPISLSDQTALVNDAVALATIVGSLIGIYGRITATKKIG